MDNNYIPHQNTGHATHKYLILRADAEAFKFRMDTEPGFLSELNGMFSNRTEWHPRPPLFEASEENCIAFRLWLEKEWADLPDALTTSAAAKLAGQNVRRLYELIHAGELHGISAGGKQYCPKEEFIAYCALPKNLTNPTTQTYKELIKKFQESQSCESENEKRRL